MNKKLKNLGGKNYLTNNMNKKCYYAHSMHIYNTPQEQRDIKTLEELGYEVINPNNIAIQLDIKKIKEKNPDGNYMDYFENLVANCEVLAFRANIDLRIPAGVAKEIHFAINREVKIFELPTLLESREISVEETRQILAYNGQR